MGVGREGAICEIMIVMQISLGFERMKAALIAASPGFGKLGRRPREGGDPYTPTQ